MDEKKGRGGKEEVEVDGFMKEMGVEQDSDVSSPCCGATPPPSDTMSIHSVLYMHILCCLHAYLISSNCRLSFCSLFSPIELP